MLQRLAGCPRYTLSEEALWSLDALGMASIFKSVQVQSTASMIRMVLQSATTFFKMKALYDEALDEDDRMLRSLVSREVPAFDTPAIVNTLQKAIDYEFLPDKLHTAWKLHFQSLVHGTQSEFLSKRMQRWRPAVSDTGKNWWDFCGPFAVNLCRHELSGAPRCVGAAYI